MLGAIITYLAYLMFYMPTSPVQFYVGSPSLTTMI